MSEVKKYINRDLLIKNILGLITLLFYFIYIGISMKLNKGNPTINVILLVLTIIYLILYIYNTFIENNKVMRKKSKKYFKRGKKILGFVNACLLLVSVTTVKNSFLSIIFAIFTIIWSILYLLFDILSAYILHRFKNFKERFKYGNRS